MFLLHNHHTEMVLWKWKCITGNYEAGPLTFGGVYGLSFRHILSYQYMVGIIPGNTMLKALGGTFFMCSLLGRYHTGSIILQWVS